MEASTAETITAVATALTVGAMGYSIVRDYLDRREKQNPTIAPYVEEHGNLLKIRLQITNKYHEAIFINEFWFSRPYGVLVGGEEQRDMYGDVTGVSQPQQKVLYLNFEVGPNERKTLEVYAAPRPSWPGGTPTFCLKWSSSSDVIRERRVCVRTSKRLTINNAID